MSRIDSRQPNQLRPIRLTRGWTKYAEGSCLIECGDTRVLCTVTVENSLPQWKRGSGSGWLTAEYGMLPRATGKRTQRGAAKGKQDGRTVEIQRLIGRSLRAGIDLDALGEHTVIIDCDVLQADGGTRCAAITGSWVALYEALATLRDAGTIPNIPLKGTLAAVSVGIVDGEAMLDLCYEEDSRAHVDMNVVMTGEGRLIEVQATGEGATFSPEELGRMLDLAKEGTEQLMKAQNEAIAELIK